MDKEKAQMERCGQCKQFTRTKDNEKDLCGAWDQPTLATRQACEFFISKKLSLFSAKQDSTQG